MWLVQKFHMSALLVVAQKNELSCPLLLLKVRRSELHALIEKGAFCWHRFHFKFTTVGAVY